MPRLGRGYPVKSLLTPAPVKLLPAVTYDATGAGNSSNTLSLTYLHTIAGNGILVGLDVFGITGSIPSATATVGSTNIPLLDSVLYYSVSSPIVSNFTIFLFGLLSPPTGSQTISINVSGPVSAIISANSVSYKNVSSFGSPVTNTSATGTALSLSVPAPGSYQIAFAAFGSDTALSSFNQTNRSNTSYSNIADLGLSDAPGGSTVNFSCTQSSSDPWAAIGLAIN